MNFLVQIEVLNQNNNSLVNRYRGYEEYMRIHKRIRENYSDNLNDMTTYKTEYIRDKNAIGNRFWCSLWYESIQTFVVFRMFHIETKCQKKEAGHDN